MDLKFKEGSPSTRSKVLITVLTLVFGVLAALSAQSGIIFIPPISALLVILFLAEREGKRVLSCVVPVVIIVIDVIFNLYYSYVCAGAAIVALVIYFVLTRGLFSKGELSLLLTVLVSVLIGALCITYALFVIEHQSAALAELGIAVEGEGVSAAVDFYQKLFMTVKTQFLEELDKFLAALPDSEKSTMLNAELISTLFDSYFNSLFSTIAIIAFALVGFTMKLFGIIASRLADDKSCFAEWRFRLSPLYAYLYVIAVVAQIFLRTGIAAVVLSNLVSLFMVMFAYVGFTSAVSFVSARMRHKAVAVLLVILACILFYPISVNILSFLGVFVTPILNRPRPPKEDGEDT